MKTLSELYKEAKLISDIFFGIYCNKDRCKKCKFKTNEDDCFSFRMEALYFDLMETTGFILKSLGDVK